MTLPDSHPHPNGDAAATEGALLRLDQGSIYVRQDGPRDAPALLLIHGSATSSRSWDALVPLLATSHRVIRIDLPGHGRSAEPVDGDYAPQEQGRRIGTVLDRLGVECAIVVGHSSGGYAAAALAGQRPDLVTALALINTGPSMDAFIAPGSTPMDATRWPPTDEQIRQFASTGFRTGYEVPQELVDDLRGMTYHAVTTAMQASIAYLQQRALPDRLMSLGKPLQVVFGDQDRRWRPSSAVDYRVVPGARIELLAGAGHTPILEEPARTAALLLAFTAIHNAPAPTTP
ncbi:MULTISPECIES: alpha/beta fold hydrolase [Streptomyces]|uniref:Alpha/beta hydrolase n=1 Tax=Streptomyces venezuelae TaxID=54571 RepID=A0A5P2B120_STRVZ|nr:alpha/beta fold hydrolase [Streptomyces venezuelae]QES24184.1 alpha/beta hydrolase [Streptomyces venezuelae]